MGDFNNANINPLLREFKLHQFNSNPTRGSNCLDIILSNAPACYNCLNIQPFGNSDHQTVYAFANNDKYKRTLPKQIKIEARSGKIKDVVEAIRQIE